MSHLPNRFIFCITPEQHRELMETAARLGQSASELVRRGITAVLADSKGQEESKCATQERC
jgi:Arc/MetJ-type ribon-helix-helix transcriptional regulator